MQYRDRTFNAFDPAKKLLVSRQGTYMGTSCQPGDPVPADVDVETCRRLWMSHYVTYEEDHTPTPEQATHGAGKEWMDEADGVTVAEGEGGWFTIQAAWLGEGEKVRGAEAAEVRAAEVRAEGDTHGIEYAHSGGGWYLITGPGVPADLKIKGEEAAKAKVTELRAAAGQTPVQPLSAEEVAALVKLEADGDDFLVTAPWLDADERFAEEAPAQERQAAVREAGPPEGWVPQAETEAGA